MRIPIPSPLELIPTQSYYSIFVTVFTSQAPELRPCLFLHTSSDKSSHLLPATSTFHALKTIHHLRRTTNDTAYTHIYLRLSSNLTRLSPYCLICEHDQSPLASHITYNGRKQWSRCPGAELCSKHHHRWTNHRADRLGFPREVLRDHEQEPREALRSSSHSLPTSDSYAN